MRVCAAIAMMRRPAPTLPVKQTLATASFWISGPPMVASSPVMMLSTPAGSAAAMRSTARTVASGALSGGLTITVLPASNASGNEAPRIASGQLNGRMIVTTPSGMRSTVVDENGVENLVGSSISPASATVCWKSRPKSAMSSIDSNSILPFSSVSNRMMSGGGGSRKDDAADIASARSLAVRADQAGNAAPAASTAARACASLAAAASPITRSGRAGSTMDRYRSADRLSPAMKSSVRTTSTGASSTVVIEPPAGVGLRGTGSFPGCCGACACPRSPGSPGRGSTSG